MSAQSDIALIAGQGGLPGLVAEAAPGLLVCEMEGTPSEIGTPETLRFRIERLVPFLDSLTDRGIKRVVFAGAIQRPRVDVEMIDPRSAQLVPQLAVAMQTGDDATLRAVIEIFEDFDFEVIGAHDIARDLVPEAGLLLGDPSASERADVERAAAIVADLGRADIGQGAVVSNGLCVAVETLPGTDAMLEFVKHHRALRADLPARSGVFYKAPKPGQDRRADLPTIGVATVRHAAEAGLLGIAFEAGGVMIIERDAVIEAAREAGLFLWARAS
ncbi:phosphatidate cytidylyltransferase [Thioclava dalianensis]|uniref:Phosphatidate cytidylyltransferase n=1 Tax=Thioclava dalianensis TaxID=1185766 RepID=A0A074TEG5_9RHOB|nr:UDP-2,3-diacylglucosamine diphosphatase LpxI [Thioclava dalianensis]KEP70074.1 phosphatidate cytidylyltransferase [Thioclava dalianensis]SFN51923.1 hypothetical protein SAMN05216224_106164 [Thioclava dalianensis]